MASKLACIKTIDVFFSFVLQYLLLNINVDWISVIGACLIITGTFFVLIFKIMENRYLIFKQKKNKELVNVEYEHESTNDEQSANKIKNGSLLNMILKIIFSKF